MTMKHCGPSFTDALPFLDQIRKTVNLNDPSTLWNALDSYLQFCCDTGFMIGNTSLYHAVGISKETASKWSKGQRKAHNPEYKRFADMAKAICACAREQYGLEGQTSYLMTIWLQKRYDGFTDSPPEEYIENPLGDLPDANKLIEKYGSVNDA